LEVVSRDVGLTSKLIYDVVMHTTPGWLVLFTQCAKETMEETGCCQCNNTSPQTPLPWPPDGGRQHDN